MAMFLTVVANIGLGGAGTTFLVDIHTFPSSFPSLLDNQHASFEFLSVAAVHG